MADQAARGRERGPMWSLRLWLFAAAVLGVLAVGTGAVATFAARGTVRESTAELTDRLRPAQSATQQLLTAYVDEETGQRGFILTGDEEFLAPYRLGEAQVRRLELRLEQQLAPDPAAHALLREAEAAGDTWHHHVTEEIGMVEAGGPGTVRDVLVQRQDKEIFDRLRDRLDDLRLEVNRLVDNEVRRLSTAQSRVDTAMVFALGLAIAALACTVALLWLALTRPLRILVDQLDTVARGQTWRSIDVAGPEEIRRIVDAAETMRVSIVDRSTELATAQHELGVQNERQRLAADLHDTTIQRLFGLGLKLSAVASQRPETATTLNALIEEADEIIRQLRRMIFELDAAESAPRSDPGVTAGASSGGVPATGATAEEPAVPQGSSPDSLASEPAEGSVASDASARGPSTP